MKVIKKIIISFAMLSLIISLWCTSSQTEINENNIEIKGPTLKISLITTAYDVYRANYKNATFNESLYNNLGEYEKKYYNWLKETYATMDNENRRRINRIFNAYESESLVSELLALDDDAKVKDIVEKLNNKSNLYPSEMIKEDIEVFFNYFYREHLKVLIEEYNTKFEERVAEINSFFYNEDIDISKFMEQGIKVEFDKKYKVILYYDLSPVDTLVFEYGDNYISTIKPDVSQENLLSSNF